MVSIISADQRRLPEPLDLSVLLSEAVGLGSGDPWVFLGNSKVCFFVGITMPFAPSPSYHMLSPSIVAMVTIPRKMGGANGIEKNPHEPLFGVSEVKEATGKGWS